MIRRACLQAIYIQRNGRQLPSNRKEHFSSRKSKKNSVSLVLYFSFMGKQVRILHQVEQYKGRHVLEIKEYSSFGSEAK